MASSLRDFDEGEQENPLIKLRKELREKYESYKRSNDNIDNCDEKSISANEKRLFSPIRPSVKGYMLGSTSYCFANKLSPLLSSSELNSEQSIHKDTFYSVNSSINDDFLGEGKSPEMDSNSGRDKSSTVLSTNVSLETMVSAVTEKKTENKIGLSLVKVKSDELRLLKKKNVQCKNADVACGSKAIFGVDDMDKWMKDHLFILYQTFPETDEVYLSERCREVCGNDAWFESLINELFIIQKPTKNATETRSSADSDYFEFNWEEYCGRHSNSSKTKKQICSLNLEGQQKKQINHETEIKRKIRSGCNHQNGFVQVEHSPVDTERLGGFAQAEPNSSILAVTTQRRCTWCLSSGDLLYCSLDETHLYCSFCVAQHCESLIQRENVEFSCVDPSCYGVYTDHVLRNYLHNAEKLLQQLQEIQIKAADLEGAEKCPFCTFVICFDCPPSSGNPVFYCNNPDCKMKSCRMCKKEFHGVCSDRKAASGFLSVPASSDRDSGAGAQLTGSNRTSVKHVEDILGRAS